MVGTDEAGYGCAWRVERFDFDGVRGGGVGGFCPEGNGEDFVEVCVEDDEVAGEDEVGFYFAD